VAFPAEQRIGINGGLPEVPMSGVAGSTAAPAKSEDDEENLAGNTGLSGIS
jgi:hypothetical protein